MSEKTVKQLEKELEEFKAQKDEEILNLKKTIKILEITNANLTLDKLALEATAMGIPVKKTLS